MWPCFAVGPFVTCSGDSSLHRVMKIMLQIIHQTKYRMLWSVKSFCQAHLLETYNGPRNFNYGDIAHLCHVGFCVHFQSRQRVWAATRYALSAIVLPFNYPGVFFINSRLWFFLVTFMVSNLLLVHYIFHNLYICEKYLVLL